MLTRQLSFVVLLFLLTVSLNASMKRYEVKTGEVVYEIVGEGSVMGITTKLTGNSSILFKDYGAVEMMYEKTTQVVMGEKDTQEDLTKFDNGTVYSIDDEEKVIYKQTIGETEDLYLANKGEQSLIALGGKKVGTSTILGFKCDLWEFSDATMCIYKSIPLKIETTVMGVNQIQTATKANFDISISEDKFKLPAYPIKTMGEMMDENMNQMEDMSPEQKKMMEEMMKNMSGMMGGQK